MLFRDEANYEARSIQSPLRNIENIHANCMIRRSVYQLTDAERELSEVCSSLENVC